ncbi:MAG: protein kinase, partial [Cyanobacteria bacterium P01_A01_bin.83]
EVKQLAQAILEILKYLHSCQPSVIHRDIKPSNILLSDRSGNSVGQVYLVDFGSVQNVAAKNNTITVVGTYGYMPPEQFGGRVQPASDLYSLGATLIYLVTGEHPADLPETELKIEFEEFCNLSPGFSNWLKQITNPSLSNRFTSATQALAELSACKNYQGQETKKFVQPPNSKIILRQNDDSWEAIMPPKNFHWQGKLNTISIILFCWLPSAVIIIALLMGIPIETVLEQSIQHFGIWAGATLAAVVSSYQFFKPMLTNRRLKIDSSAVILMEQVFGFNLDCIFARGKNTLEKLEINTVHNINNVFFSFNIYLAGDKFELVNNHDYPVTSQDIDWLAEELSIWLNHPLSKTGVTDNCDLSEDYFVRGVAYCYSGDHQSAMFNFRRKTILEPTASNYYNLAAIQFTQEMYADALKSFNSCIKLDDRLKFAYYGRANIHFEFNNPEALQDFNTANNLEKSAEDKSHLNDEHGYYFRGLAKYQIGKNLTQALEDFEQAKKIAAKHQYKDLEDKAIALINEINGN